MNVDKAELIISAVTPEQYPEADKPEFVLLGRSNVGKSTFINTLIKRKALARTSSQPGKTQTMNFYDIAGKDKGFVFVDMPGYGYAKVSKKERAKWGNMIEEYLQNRKEISDVFLLVDSRVGPTEDDKLMYDWLKYYDFHPVIIATKIDKLGTTKRKKALNKIRDGLELQPEDLLIPFSMNKNIGFSEAWNVIEEHI